MAIFYPPPMPVFPRPQAQITQASPPGAFTQVAAYESPTIPVRGWLPPETPPARLQFAPVFPAPPVVDLGFLSRSTASILAGLSSWQVPVSVPIFTAPAPQQGAVSTPIPLQVNTAFNTFLETPPVHTPPVRITSLPVVPQPPDLGYLFNPTLRIISSVAAAYRAIAETPQATRATQTQPLTGTSPSQVLQSAFAASGQQAQAIQLVWLVPPIAALRLLPVPNFPMPPAPPAGAFADDRLMIGISVSF